MSSPHDSLTRVRNSLLSTYRRWLLPAGLALACIWAARQTGVLAISSSAVDAVAGPAVFIAAIASALALPLLHRGHFVHRVQGLKGVPAEELLGFERTQLRLVLLSWYAAAIGYHLDVSVFHFGGAFLAALYGAYFYYPTRRRVSRELVIFRASVGQTQGQP